MTALQAFIGYGPLILFAVLVTYIEIRERSKTKR